MSSPGCSARPAHPVAVLLTEADLVRSNRPGSHEDATAWKRQQDKSLIQLMYALAEARLHAAVCGDGLGFGTCSP